MAAKSLFGKSSPCQALVAKDDFLADQHSGEDALANCSLEKMENGQIQGKPSVIPGINTPHTTPPHRSALVSETTVEPS